MERTVIPFILQIAFAVAASGAFILVGFLFSPKRFTKKKMDAYECGAGYFHDARVPIEIKFYVIAVLFLLFEVEVVFFFPFAASLKSFIREGSSIRALAGMLVFVAVLFVGYLYARAKGALSFRE
ncbi:MAG: NADH-quinone oxidoreductase subunit A [Spirochaetota bacterium]